MFKSKHKINIIMVLAMAIMLTIFIQSNVSAKLVKDAEGSDKVTLNFSQNETFEIKNLFGDIDSDYKITFKKNDLNKSAVFSASGDSNVNIDVFMLPEDKVSKKENGYLELSNGLIIQWGKAKIRSDDRWEAVYYNKPFPNNVLNLNAQHLGGTGGAKKVKLEEDYIYNNHFKAYYKDLRWEYISWTAIGY